MYVHIHLVTHALLECVYVCTHTSRDTRPARMSRLECHARKMCWCLHAVRVSREILVQIYTHSRRDISTYLHTLLESWGCIAEYSGVYCRSTSLHCYGVATISKLLKIMGLFCKRAVYKNSIAEYRLFRGLFCNTALNISPLQKRHSAIEFLYTALKIMSLAPVLQNIQEKRHSAIEFLYTALLQKRPIILRSLLIVATP